MNTNWTPNQTCKIWRGDDNTYFKDLSIQHKKQSGPSCVATTLSMIVESLGFTADFETEGYTSGVGTYTEYSRVNLSKSSTGTTSGTDIVTITPISHTENIGVGMSVTGSGIRTGSKIKSGGINAVSIVIS